MIATSRNKGIIYCKKDYIKISNISRKFIKTFEYEYTIYDSGNFSVINKNIFSIQCTSQDKFFEIFGNYFENKSDRRKRLIKKILFKIK